MTDFRDDQARRWAVREPKGQRSKPGAGAGQAETPPLKTISMADVKAERVDWLWPGRIPRGKLTLLVGEPEAGKSLISLSVAALVSTGAPWPFHSERREPAGVLLACPEDGAADTVKPRLEAAGADCGRIHLLADETFDLTDTERLERFIVDHSIALLILDPVTAYLPPKSDGNDEGSVRALLHPLVALAERTRVAIVGVKHTRKASADTPLKRVLGAVAWGATARAVWGAAPFPDDPDTRAFCKVKLNIARDPGTLIYTIGEAAVGFDGIMAPIVNWTREDATVRAVDVFRPAGEDGPKGERREQAVDFLRDLLKAGPARESTVKEAAKEAGIAWTTIKRAKAELKVVSSLKGRVGAPGSVWFWKLPGAREDRT